MSEANNLSDFYKQVQQQGKLRTPDHAKRWSAAVLNMLGLNLDRKTKKKLARALPPELSEDLTRVFRLLYFRNTGLARHEFLDQISRRSGNTDTDFAEYPTEAVFGSLKEILSPELDEQVARSLSPEVRQLWQQA